VPLATRRLGNGWRIGCRCRLSGERRYCCAQRHIRGQHAVIAAPVPDLFARPRHPYCRALIACAPELGNREKSAVPIPGSPPAPGDPPAGCHFTPRCPHAAAICRGEPMGLLDAGPSRRVRCMRWKELVS
jgi:oligopeptide/dipeptide ABC transporter ATP-binding protein